MTVSVLAAITLVAAAGCGSDVTVEAETATTAPPSSSEEKSAVDPTTTAAPEGATPEGATHEGDAGDGAPKPTPEGDAPKCTAADISPELTDPSGASPSGQVLIQLRYTNSGAAPCFVEGLPGATLKGEPNDRFGPEYQLARSDSTESSKIILAPGKTAAADITLGTVPLDDPRGWQATELLTIPAGDTEVMTLPFPEDLPVLRQDGATRPATFIEAFTGPLS